MRMIELIMLEPNELNALLAPLSEETVTDILLLMYASQSALRVANRLLDGDARERAIHDILDEEVPM